MRFNLAVNRLLHHGCKTDARWTATVSGSGIAGKLAGRGTRFAPAENGALIREVRTMASDLKRGDHVEWNSEAGRVRGTVQKKVTREITFKGYKRHASKEEPQYIIKSDKTDHLAIHKGSALKRIKKRKG
jgi:hypothetical protein